VGTNHISETTEARVVKFLLCDAMLARYVLSSCVRLSIHLSLGYRIALFVDPFGGMLACHGQTVGRQRPTSIASRVVASTI